jgi:hypothetical protein
VSSINCTEYSGWIGYVLSEEKRVLLGTYYWNRPSLLNTACVLCCVYWLILPSFRILYFRPASATSCLILTTSSLFLYVFHPSSPRNVLIYLCFFHPFELALRISSTRLDLLSDLTWALPLLSNLKSRSKPRLKGEG